MRFTPGTITVPAGDRLVINLHNTGEDRHDLVLDTGQQTPRLDPGQRAELDVGVVGRPIEGWCSVAGHRQMGMVLSIEVVGATPVAPASDPHAAHDHGTTDLRLDSWI
jgi:nitrite reductase (NO-forming)